MMASHVSGITMLGMSGESYIRGMIVVLMYTTGIFIVPIIAVCYLPVFFEVKVVSIYEVIDERLHEQYRLLVQAMLLFREDQLHRANIARIYNRMRRVEYYLSRDEKKCEIKFGNKSRAFSKVSNQIAG